MKIKEQKKNKQIAILILILVFIFLILYIVFQNKQSSNHPAKVYEYAVTNSASEFIGEIGEIVPNDLEGLSSDEIYEYFDQFLNEHILD